VLPISRLSVAILDDWDQLAFQSPSVQALREFADVRIFTDSIPVARLPEAITGCDALIAIRERTRFTKELLATLPDLRHIAQTGHGVAHIDVSAANARSIQISITPGGSTQSVAELTLGLMLAVAHRIAEGDRPGHHRLRSGSSGEAFRYEPADLEP
jgi:D-3-phosphoglycerate dehydrogenase